LKRWLVTVLACVPVVACRSVSDEAHRTERPPAWAEGERSVLVRASRLGPANDSSTDAAISALGLGIAQNLRDGFALRGELELAGLTGDDAGADAGGALIGSLRWNALRGRRWSVFLELGLGALLSNDDFPQGGTSANFLRETGLGVQFALTETVGVTAGVRQRHVSNGRGLVDDNPSWEGLGGYVGLDFELPPAASIHEARIDPVVAPPQPWSLRVEVQGGEIEGESARGAAIAFDSRLIGAYYGGVRFAFDELDGEALREWGGALYRLADRGLADLSFDRQSLDTFRDDEVAIFGEFHANDLATVTGGLGYGARSHDADRALCSLIFHLYPIDSLALVAGIAARDPLDDFGAASFDVPLGIEYAPDFLRRYGGSLFAEDGLNDEARVLGVRGTLGPDHLVVPSLRDRQRSAGPLRRRP
jgi:lipid A 3-O-deacylase PagL